MVYMEMETTEPFRTSSAQRFWLKLQQARVKAVGEVPGSLVFTTFYTDGESFGNLAVVLSLA